MNHQRRIIAVSAVCGLLVLGAAGLAAASGGGHRTPSVNKTGSNSVGKLAKAITPGSVGGTITSVEASEPPEASEPTEASEVENETASSTATGAVTGTANGGANGAPTTNTKRRGKNGGTNATTVTTNGGGDNGGGDNGGGDND